MKCFKVTPRDKIRLAVIKYTYEERRRRAKKAGAESRHTAEFLILLETHWKSQNSYFYPDLVQKIWIFWMKLGSSCLEDQALDDSLQSGPVAHKRGKYSAPRLTDGVETGLPDMVMFKRLAGFVVHLRSLSSIWLKRLITSASFIFSLLYHSESTCLF